MSDQETQFYAIIVSESSAELSKEVNRWMAKGWSLQGGIAFSMTHSLGGSMIQKFAQAMTIPTNPTTTHE